jgi:hypothetical protein
MSLNPTFPQVAASSADPERGHRLRLRIGYWVASLSMLLVFIYGFDYYVSSAEQRALSPKHALLKPSGTIGLHLGMLGFFLFLIVYLYPIRLRWAWLGRQGSSRHWLDFHVLMGLVAPLIITFHSSFKFSGIAGVAYWIMVFVALSGLVGRYIYAQIPRSLSFAELSFKEGREQAEKLTEQLKSLGVVSPRDIEGLLHLPDMRQAEQMSLVGALGKMMLFDLVFPFRVWRLRQKMLWSHRRWWSLVGFGKTQNAPLERAVALAREQAVLSKKVLFLSKSQQMLKLWHVIHRPFSYSFAVLAAIHVILMVMLGYY